MPIICKRNKPAIIFIVIGYGMGIVGLIISWIVIPSDGYEFFRLLLDSESFRVITDFVLVLLLVGSTIGIIGSIMCITSESDVPDTQDS